jgi:hypothetical protein
MLCLLGCELTKDNSGSIGTFDVTAAVQANTCGPQVAPESAGSYAVEILLRGDLIRWRPVGGTEAPGSYDARTGAFRVQLERDIVVQAADVRRNIVGCTVHQVDLVQGVLDVASLDAGADASADVAMDAAVDAGDAGDARVDGGALDGRASEGPRPSFTGVSSVYYGAVAGGDCAGLIGVGQGQLLALPCSYSYQLRGVRR